MPRDSRRLCADALKIWQAGLAAVDSRSLVRAAVRVEGGRLHIGNETFDLPRIRRILVIGAGKAVPEWLKASKRPLGRRSWSRNRSRAGSTSRPTACGSCTQFTCTPCAHQARTSPRPRARPGPTRSYAWSVRHRPTICASRSSPAAEARCCLRRPRASRLPKSSPSRAIQRRGADIRELNTVRKQLSSIKGGGLLRACRAGHLVTLIISDVIGDPLDVIASGPTVEDTSTPAEALAILEKFQARAAGISGAVFDYLRAPFTVPLQGGACTVTNIVIGNNATATDAAARAAATSGYSAEILPARPQEGTAEDVGRRLAKLIPGMRAGPGADCLINGGEPVVQLVSDDRRGMGGRNQQLVLAAAEALARRKADGFAFLSAGTDGEDGPTDAAGAIIDAQVLAAGRQLGLVAADFLARDDAYHFFEPLGALVKTGPTHTNVCDVRVVVVDRMARDAAGKRGAAD